MTPRSTATPSATSSAAHDTSPPGGTLSTLRSHFVGEMHLEVSPGWVPIVQRLNVELSALDPGYRLSSLHAHDGELQVRWEPGEEPGWPRHPGDGDPEALERYNDEVRRYLGSLVHLRRAQWEDRIREYGAAAVLRAWRDGAHTCEECGASTDRHLGRRLVCGSCQGLPYN